MTELLANISIKSEEINIILLIGIAIFGGTVGARIFHRLSIPRIVGYVAIGIMLGPLLGIILPKRKITPLSYSFIILITLDRMKKMISAATI